MAGSGVLLWEEQRPMADWRMPSGYVLKARGAVRVAVRGDLAPRIEAMGVFEGNDPAAWPGAAGRLDGGRSRPVRLDLGEGKILVIKELLRGGLLGRVNRRYHLGAERLLGELRLCARLAARGVPVAPVVLGRAERLRPGIWLLHLATEEVPAAKDLLRFMEEAAGTGTPDAVFKAAGEAVRTLHEAGVYHRDLNLGNLLVAGGPGGRVPLVRIIDLDRSPVRERLSEGARASNLARLYRHALKNGLGGSPEFARIWKAFLFGYCRERGEEAALWEAKVERAYLNTRLLHWISWRLQRRS